MNKGMEIRQAEMGFHPIPMDRDVFEGWYYRLWDERISLAVIVGFSWNQNGREVFVQTLDTVTGKSQRYDFDWSAVTLNDHPFRIQIAQNVFTQSSLYLHLPELEVRLKYGEITPLPYSWFKPTIMGPFSYLKAMECVHSVISLHHRAEGLVTIGSQAIPVQGLGYLEKDRGSSFPKEYLWFQSNDCGVPDSCFFLSAADIPFGPIHFTGLLFIVKLGSEIHWHATYTGCRLTSLSCGINEEQKTEVTLRLSQGSTNIAVTLIQGRTMALAAPVSGKMKGRVEESLEAEASVMILKGGKRIHESRWSHGGLELSQRKTSSSDDA